MKTIKVTNCWECPFGNWDDMSGVSDCNIKELQNKENQLPKDKVHEECPLKDSSVSVEL